MTVARRVALAAGACVLASACDSAPRVADSAVPAGAPVASAPATPDTTSRQPAPAVTFRIPGGYYLPLDSADVGGVTIEHFELRGVASFNPSPGDSLKVELRATLAGGSEESFDCGRAVMTPDSLALRCDVGGGATLVLDAAFTPVMRAWDGGSDLDALYLHPVLEATARLERDGATVGDRRIPFRYWTGG